MKDTERGNPWQEAPVLEAGRAGEIEVLTGDAALQAVEESANAAGVDDAADLLSDRPNEAIDDPHRLARLYVRQHDTRDGTQCLWFWRDEWQRWDGTAYRIVASPEIRAEITRLVKAEFDETKTGKLYASMQNRSCGAE